MQVSSSRLPYQERALERRLTVLPRVALSAADGYVSSVSLMGAGLVPEVLPRVEGMGTFFGLAGGALALGHAVAGYRALSESPRSETEKARNLRRLQGAADLVAAAGLAGQAFGLGPWTAALVVAGSLTASITNGWRRT